MRIQEDSSVSDVEIRLQNIDRQEPELPSGANDTSALKEAAGEEEHVSEKKDVGEAETDTEKSTSVVQEAANPDVTAEQPAAPDDDTLAAAMEAILFAMGDAVPMDSIVQALGVSREHAVKVADLLSERYRQSGSGVSLNWYEDALQLSTKPELYEYLIRIASEPKKPRLTPTLLETLSIIAFRQPVTRMEVENIRGVNSDFAINRLVSFDLVQEVGRKEVPGRPLLFGTTQQFLRSFGISSVDELPEPDSSHMEVFREEAEEEVSSRLNI
jgi:segregation and condensation protein B